jgi:hypothetical protein
VAAVPDKEMIALGIRQPWAELILRGVKTIEVRTTATNIRGRIYVYASKLVSDHPAAAEAVRKWDLDVENLLRSMIVGTVEIESTGPVGPHDASAACLRGSDLAGPGLIGWRMCRPERLETPLAARFIPYGIWFYPFRRRTKSSP